MNTILIMTVKAYSGRYFFHTGFVSEKSGAGSGDDIIQLRKKDFDMADDVRDAAREAFTSQMS